MVQGKEGKSYRRVGALEKCPACGVSVDPGAYRCPRCLIYFCFKCRRRVQKGDDQFQCLNQQCDYHGKLLCSNCITVTVTESPSYDHLGCFAFLLFCAIFIGVFAASNLGAFIGALTGVGLFILVYFLFAVKWAFFKETTRHRCCIGCNRPVENLV